MVRNYDEVEKWGKWVIEPVKEEVGELYPPIPDPENPPTEIKREHQLRLDDIEDNQQYLKSKGSSLAPSPLLLIYELGQ